ncbi:MAG: TonB C-terminal domain-containing protein [Rhizobiales bacterium]|nr:TonB C-terminal domain-containing protein [Hyphomicrobiales bacterium]
MALPRIDKGMAVSATAHVAVLLWAGLSFAAKPLEAPQQDAVFVETMSFSEFSQMTAGSKKATKTDTPKPLVEKKDEPKPVENQEAKISDKPEVVASTASSTPPPEEAKKPEPQPMPREAKPEPRPEPKREPEKKVPDAEALKKNDKPKKEEPKKDEARKEEPKKKEAKKPEPPKPLPPKKPEKKVVEHKPQPEQEQSRFDASRIAALLDKREPRRMAAAGETLNNTPALGTATGTAAKLSQNEIDALRARIQQCWNPPAGAAEARDLVVQVRILFQPDGSLAADPRLISRTSSSYQQIAAESALRAIRRCAPYSFMPAAKYEAWKDVEVTFDPRDLFRG